MIEFNFIELDDWLRCGVCKMDYRKGAPVSKCCISGCPFPDEGRAPVPSDRGLILIALTQEEADAAAKRLADKFHELMARKPLPKNP